MKRYIAILGTVLIATILISGSVVAPWHYVTWIEEENTTNINNINGGPGDDAFATLGKNSPDTLGWVTLDLGSGSEMEPDEDFTVFAKPENNEVEDYEVWVGETIEEFVYVGGDDDDEDHDFTTPSTEGKSWRYILITATKGIPGTPGDPIFGPEINAVGYYR